MYTVKMPDKLAARTREISKKRLKSGNKTIHREQGPVLTMNAVESLKSYWGEIIVTSNKNEIAHPELYSFLYLNSLKDLVSVVKKRRCVLAYGIQMIDSRKSSIVSLDIEIRTDTQKAGSVSLGMSVSEPSVYNAEDEELKSVRKFFLTVGSAGERRILGATPETFEAFGLNFSSEEILRAGGFERGGTNPPTAPFNLCTTPSQNLTTRLITVFRGAEFHSADPFKQLQSGKAVLWNVHTKDGRMAVIKSKGKAKEMGDGDGKLFEMEYGEEQALCLQAGQDGEYDRLTDHKELSSLERERSLLQDHEDKELQGICERSSASKVEEGSNAGPIGITDGRRAFQPRGGAAPFPLREFTTPFDQVESPRSRAMVEQHLPLSQTPPAETRIDVPRPPPLSLVTDRQWDENQGILFPELDALEEFCPVPPRPSPEKEPPSASRAPQNDRPVQETGRRLSRRKKQLPQRYEGYQVEGCYQAGAKQEKSVSLRCSQGRHTAQQRVAERKKRKRGAKKKKCSKMRKLRKLSTRPTVFRGGSHTNSPFHPQAAWRSKAGQKTMAPKALFAEQPECSRQRSGSRVWEKRDGALRMSPAHRQ